MSVRLLTRLNVTFRGVPLGWFYLVEVDRQQTIEPLLPASIQSRLDREPSLSAGEFTAFSAFADATVRLSELLREISAAGDTWRAVMAQPVSAETREESDALWNRMLNLERVYEEARATFEQQLEVREESGDMIPVTAHLRSVEPPAIGADFEFLPAPVAARLRALHVNGQDGIEPTAV